MVRCFFVFFIVMVSYETLAQNSVSKFLKGKVISSTADLEGIYIVNLKSDQSTSTEKGGYFSIAASVGDTLMFSAFQIKGTKIAVQENDFTSALFFVRLEPVMNQLDEVKVLRNNKINAVSLGIIPAGQKSYTPAERKLKTASGNDGQLGLNTIVSFDPLLNWISGRTSMLKKEVEVEKKEFLLQKLEDLFDESYFIEKLKIPKIYLKGFWYYAVENESLVNAMNAKNRTMAVFILNELAAEYKEIIKVED